MLGFLLRASPAKGVPMPESSATAPRVVRFDVFELDLHSGELLQAGVRVGLPDQAWHLRRIAEVVAPPSGSHARQSRAPW
jgi:hypothetical protein